MAETKDFYGMYLEKITKKGGMLQYIRHKEKGPVGMMVRRITFNLDARARILEIGTGSGVLGALLAQNGFSVTAIDNDAKMLKMAKSCANILAADLECIVADAFMLGNQYAENNFDCVVSYGLMEHFSDEDIVKLIKLQKRLAKRVVFCVPSANIALRYQQKGNGTERYMHMSEWTKLLRDARIFNIKAFGFGYGEKSRYSFIPEVVGRNNLTSRMLASFAGFYEFWV